LNQALACRRKTSQDCKPLLSAVPARHGLLQMPRFQAYNAVWPSMLKCKVWLAGVCIITTLAALWPQGLMVMTWTIVEAPCLPVSFMGRSAVSGGTVPPCRNLVVRLPPRLRLRVIGPTVMSILSHYIAAEGRDGGRRKRRALGHRFGGPINTPSNHQPVFATETPINGKCPRKRFCKNRTEKTWQPARQGVSRIPVWMGQLQSTCVHR